MRDEHEEAQTTGSCGEGRCQAAQEMEQQSARLTSADPGSGPTWLHLRASRRLPGGAGTSGYPRA